jgi:pentatricopeptide repeat protein
MDLENWSKNAPEEPVKLCPLFFFVAAHFLELSELHNLQHISTEHYDCFVEHFVSLGFDQKRESKEFTIEEKLQVMQSIAEELPVSFDVKKLELKLWPTSETEYDMFGKAIKKQVQLTVPSSSKPKYDKDAPSERKGMDILEKVSRNPVELSIPSPNKQNCERRKYEDAPARHDEEVEILSLGDDSKVKLGVVSYNTVLGRNGRPDDALQLFDRMCREYY